VTKEIIRAYCGFIIMKGLVNFNISNDLVQTKLFILLSRECGVLAEILKRNTMEDLGFIV
jgi:uncharacterized protein with ATP-grasp and redox domains